MNTLLVLFTSLAAASASVVQLPALYTAAIPTAAQYYDQNGLGQYSYGYSGGPSAKAEYKSLDGVTRGSYTYVDADGELQTVEYTADSANGFQALATNLPKAPVDDKLPPKPVEDTPEVAMAKAEHLAAVREAELRAAEDPSDGSDGQPQEQEQKNGSKEAQAALSRESTSAETESPNGSDGSNEGSSQESGINGNNGITRLVSDGLNSGLGHSGITSSIGNSPSSGLSSINLNTLNGGLTSGISGLSTLALGSIIPSTGVNGLSNIQFNGDLSSSPNNQNDALRFSEITPATTTQLRPVSLTSLGVPISATSYLRVSTPTHGYSIISPTVLTAVPTLRATSSQTISRALPISLSPKLLV